MASNQFSNQRHTGNVGQAPKAGQQSSAPVWQSRATVTRSSARVVDQREAHRDSGSLEKVRDQPTDYWARGEDQMRELVRDREGVAVLIALAAGFGLGLVLGSAIAPTPRPRTWRERMTAEGFGRRILDRIEGLIPQVVTEHFSR